MDACLAKKSLRKRTKLAELNTGESVHQYRSIANTKSSSTLVVQKFWNLLPQFLENMSLFFDADTQTKLARKLWSIGDSRVIQAMKKNLKSFDIRFYSSSSSDQSLNLFERQFDDCIRTRTCLHTSDDMRFIFVDTMLVCMKANRIIFDCLENFKENLSSIECKELYCDQLPKTINDETVDEDYSWNLSRIEMRARVLLPNLLSLHVENVCYTGRKNVGYTGSDLDTPFKLDFCPQLQHLSIGMKIFRDNIDELIEWLSENCKTLNHLENICITNVTEKETIKYIRTCVNHLRLPNHVAKFSLGDWKNMPVENGKIQPYPNSMIVKSSVTYILPTIITDTPGPISYVSFWPECNYFKNLTRLYTYEPKFELQDNIQKISTLVYLHITCRDHTFENPFRIAVGPSLVQIDIVANRASIVVKTCPDSNVLRLVTIEWIDFCNFECGDFSYRSRRRSKRRMRADHNDDSDQKKITTLHFVKSIKDGTTNMMENTVSLKI